MLVGVLVVVVDLAADPRRDSDDHRRNGDASDEGDADRRADDCFTAATAISSFST